MTDSALEAKIEQVALADLPPSEAAAVFRDLLAAAPGEFAGRAYATLSAVTLRILTGRRTQDLKGWIDLTRQVAAAADRSGQTVHGPKLVALADLIVSWLRLSEVNSAEAILERPHCRAILTELAKRNGKALRKDIIKAVGIGEANLSRILGSLEAVGLIERDSLKVRTIGLTAEGRSLLLGRLGHTTRIQKAAKVAKAGHSTRKIQPTIFGAASLNRNVALVARASDHGSTGDSLQAGFVPGAFRHLQEAATGLFHGGMTSLLGHASPAAMGLAGAPNDDEDVGVKRPLSRYAE